eukprot:evm.model.scf_2193.2 EVM.evm.TU.scf_2193.2   scf_2193:7697-13170(-)
MAARMAAGNGPAMISAVVERFKPEDVELLLANRGLPSVGGREELAERLLAALTEELCEWKWERPGQPQRSEIVAAGASAVAHKSCIYVFGGMDEERNEHMGLWKWDTAGHEGFTQVSYRGPIPQTFSAGCYAAVYKDELWVFPGPRNHNMRNVCCCDLSRHRWVERATLGEPPCETQMRRNVACFVDGNRLIVLGGTYMDRVYLFNFDSRQWSKQKTKPPQELQSWDFGGACLIGDWLYAYGSSKRISEEPTVEVWRLDIREWRWEERVLSNGTQPPPFRIHSSSAVVGRKWIIHGGRRPNVSKFNVSDQTFVFDLDEHRWSMLMAEGHQPAAREWHTALGVNDMMVVVGGRVDIPDYEPIPLSFDTMCMEVEILHYRETPAPRPPTGKANILAIYKKLYKNTYLSDVTLVVEGNQVPAHAHVLATHSTVFERMWDSRMREMETHEVVIEDVPYGTMLLLIEYMYGVLSEVPHEHAAVVELFKAADKYAVLGLVKECIVVFKKITTEHTLAPLLEVADERSNEELLQVCKEIAYKRPESVLLTDSFKHLTQRNPDLTLPFMSQVVKRLVPKGHDADGGSASSSSRRSTESRTSSRGAGPSAKKT